jgi:hypothetical protein
MNMQKGKITVLSVIIFSIMVLAAVMAFKYFAYGIEKRMIKKEIFDVMGVFRGPQLTDAKIREIVGQVLSKRSLQPMEVYSEFQSNGKINFSYKYEISINYILFQHTEIVSVEDEMENFGG